MQQLSMFDIFEPKPAPVRYEPPPRREVLTRAYGKAGHAIKIGLDDPDPVEVEIRGIPCLIVWGFGASTYAIQPPGSLFWSDTGYRSMATGGASLDDVVALVESYINRPAKKDGLGGKLERWWPLYVNQWRQSLSFVLRYGADRSKLWAQWGPEKHAEVWARWDASQAEALDRMRSEGIDPNDVDPPRWHKGKWPRFS